MEQGQRATTGSTRRGGETPVPPLAPPPADTRGGEPRDLVSIYAARIRADEQAPPLFAPQPILRVGRGTPGFRRQRPTASLRAGLSDVAASRRLTRRGRLVAIAGVAAAILTTALAGTVLAG